MKNKFLGGTIVLLLVVITTVNINVGLDTNKVPDINIINVEAIAAEWGGWSNFMQGQGFYLDEREESQPCPTVSSKSGYGGASYNDGSIYGGGSNFKINPIERKEYICLSGDENCSPYSC